MFLKKYGVKCIFDKTRQLPSDLGQRKRVSTGRSRNQLRRQPRPVLEGFMDHAPITVRKYSNFAEMKADEYRYWQSRPAHERLDAVEEMIQAAYALKGWEMEPDVPRLQRPFVRLPVPWR